ncbi:MAG: hypothetical protein WD775_12065, partial [Burkholderiales bacterium]
TSSSRSRRDAPCAMPAPRPLSAFLDPLEQLALPYCVTGSVAASVYGEPRLTADIDVILLLGPQHIALGHRRRIDIGGTGAWIAPPEYVILRKLQFYRDGGSDKHLRDIRFMLAATPVDREFVETEVARRGLQETWQAIEK